MAIGNLVCAGLFLAARRASWARLLARMYGVDALACPRCGSRLTMIAAITESAVTAAILGHLGLDDTPPPARRSARAPPDDRAPELPFAS
jgi:hypothetical protein